MSENELRDYRGRWTAGGVGYSDAHAHPAGPFMDISKPDQAAKADQVATLAAKIAVKLGYDPANINVSDESRQFELNGKTLNYAGAAMRPPEPELRINPDGSKTVINADLTGPITLYTPHIGNDEATQTGVITHEITHQKFNALLTDYRTDYLKLQHDPDYHKDTQWVPYDPNNPLHVSMRAAGDMVTSPQADGKEQIREKGFMRPDGLLNAPYDAKYPAYQAYTKAMMPGTDEFAKSDGVSDYSKEYWKGYQDRTLGSDKAYHETLAELGRVKFAGDPVYHKKLGEVDGKPVYFAQGHKGINPKWNALYKAMDENWKRRASK